MSDIISKKDKYYELLAHGYCRNIEKQNKICISIIFKTIISKYCKKYIIIGIGANAQGSLAIGRYGKLNHWTKLSELESIICNINNIYSSCQALMVIDIRNRLYFSGLNTYI